MKSHSITLKVPFHDVDPMNVVWHGHYMKYFEIARCALLDTFNYNYAEMKESGYAWPVVDLQVRYARSASFSQELRITAKLVEWENRMKIHYEVHDMETGKRLTTGSTTQVAVHIEKREMCFSSPAVLFKKLGLPVP